MLTRVCVASMALMLMSATTAQAHFHLDKNVTSGGTVNLFIIATGTGTNEIEITDYTSYGGWTYLRIEGKNGTLVEGQPVVYETMPSGDVNILDYGSSASRVTMVDLWSTLNDDLRFHDIEYVDLQGVILGGPHGDMEITAPYKVNITQSFSRHLKVGQDYAAHTSDISFSAFSRTMWVRARLNTIRTVNSGDDVYVYGTGGRDSILLDRVYASQSGSAPWDAIKVSMGMNTDFLTVEDCRASSFYANGGSGTDTIYNDGGNNFPIYWGNTSSIEWFK